MASLANVRNLAAEDASNDEDQRKAQLKKLADDLASEKSSEASGPAALLKQLQTKGAVVDPATQHDADVDAFQNSQAMRRLTRRADALAVPASSAADYTRQLAAPLGRFGTETDEQRTRELAENPRGRETDIDSLIQSMTKGSSGDDVSRETPGFSGERDYYRQEPNGTLSFTNRPEVAAEPGYRRYNSDSGLHKDLGAPGGDVGYISGAGGGAGASDKVRAAQIGDLRALSSEAQHAPFTERELAQDLSTQQPGWDVMAARSNPQDIEQAINTAVGAGNLNPKTGDKLRERYQQFNQHATDKGEFDPEIWQSQLGVGRTPATGEATQRAAAGGQVTQQVAAQQHAATQAATQPVQGAPGTTPSPTETQAPPSPGASPGVTASSLLAGLMRGGDFAAAAQRGGLDARTQNTPTPETPPGLAAGAARYGIPAMAALAAPELSIPAAAATGFGTGAAGELLGQLYGGEPVNPGRIGAAGLGNAAVAGVAGPAGRLVGRLGRSLGALGKRLGSDIPTVYSPGTGGAPTQVLGGLTEQAGAPGALSSLEQARVGSLDVGSLPIPEGPVPYLRENLPALRGGGGAVPQGAARTPDEVLTIDDLIDQYLRQNRRALPPPG